MLAKSTACSRNRPPRKSQENAERSLTFYRCINALAETINGLYKAEVIRHRGPWRNLEDVEFATLEWVDWFNNRRLFGPIGNIPPAEFEALYDGIQEAPAMAVGIT